MNFIQFERSLRDLSVLSTKDIRAIDPFFDRRRLTEWQQKGYIRKIAKGLYIFSDTDIDEGMLFRIANKLYGPSYISLETSLAYHHLIPEVVYGVTSVSTRRTYRFDTPLAHLIYRTISQRLFFGYMILHNGIRIASIEKALLDFFYLNPHLDTSVAFASLRIDRDALLDQVNHATLQDQLSRYGMDALSHRIHRFLEWIRSA